MKVRGPQWWAVIIVALSSASEWPVSQIRLGGPRDAEREDAMQFAKAVATLLAPAMRPRFSAADFLRLGPVLDDGEIVSDGLWALVELPNGEQPPS